MLNAKLNIYYDTDLALMDFVRLKQETNALFLGDRKIEYLVIFENEQIAKDPYFKRYRLERMKLSELHDLSIELDHWWNEGKRKIDIIDDLMQISNADFYDLHYENKSYCDLDHDFEIVGYSQGDCVKVKKVGSTKFKKEQFSEKYLHNIFFDCPIYGQLIIYENEKEILELYLDEFVNDRYDYSKQELLNNFHANYNNHGIISKDFIFNYLNQKLPENLEYI